MSEPVPFLDVGAGVRELEPELTAAWRRVMESGWFVLGPELEAFETEFAAYCGTRGCAGVGSGLDALRLILWAYGLGPGDEVIVPGFTFVATWFAVSLTGATPVPVDVDAATANLDPDGIADAITPHTRAVIAVHLYGQPAPMDAIAAAVAGRDIRIIEDAAQAHGATLRERRAGALGDAAAFSFYPAKNFGAFGDGGAVVSDDERLLERVRCLRNYGSPHKYRHDTVAVNSRLDELQAALLRAKLAQLEEWNRRRARIAQRYTDALRGREWLQTFADTAGASSAHHLYVVRSRAREALRRHLDKHGIQTQIHYPEPPHRCAAYRADFGGARLPVSEALAGEVLSLPLGPHLSDEQCDRVIAALDGFGH